MSEPDDRELPDDPPLELELAEVPRRLGRRSLQPIGSTMAGDPRPDEPAAPHAAPRVSSPSLSPVSPLPTLPSLPTRPPLSSSQPMPSTVPRPTTLPSPSLPRPSTLPPPSASSGRAYLDDPSPWWRRGALIVILAAGCFGAFLVYQRMFKANVYEVGRTFKTSTGVTVDVPPGTWKTDRRRRDRAEMGTGWVRTDTAFRGGDGTFDQAEDYFAVLRVHQPGAVPAMNLDDLAARAQLTIPIGVERTTYSVRNLSCAAAREMRDGAVACFGRFRFEGRELPFGCYLWVAGADDFVGVAYAAADGQLDPLHALARTAR